MQDVVKSKPNIKISKCGNARFFIIGKSFLKGNLKILKNLILNRLIKAIIDKLKD
jgi:hypothetical protein